VGVAVAARLPAFSLTANAGGMATHFADLFSRGDGFWTITAGVTQPIFEGGALLHRQRAAEASLDQAKAQYRSAVIDAFQNVADSLQALQADAAALQAADHAVASAKTSLDIAKKQLEVGETSRLTVLSAEQAYQQGLIGQVQARASRYADTAALFQALGGGWWNRSETTAKSAS
jgi:outer membrane protein TolC